MPTATTSASSTRRPSSRAEEEKEEKEEKEGRGPLLGALLLPAPPFPMPSSPLPSSSLPGFLSRTAPSTMDSNPSRGGRTHPVLDLPPSIKNSTTHPDLIKLPT
jgi:hypothetical protein